MFLGIDWKTRIRGAAPQIIIGAIIGTGALLLAFRGVDWHAVGEALLHVSVPLALLALVSVAVSLALSVTRWWLLFAPDHRNLNWFALAGAILIGQTANLVVPARPLAAWAVVVDLDPVPVGVVQVQRFADQMIGCAAEWPAHLGQLPQRTG